MAIVEVRGTVVTGKGEARKLGYPTANIAYQSTSSLEPGVWTCYVKFPEMTKPGLAVIGMWPHADGSPSLEVHIMDFAEDVYGQELIVGLQEKLRDLKSFATVDELVKAIENDIAEARTRFV